MPFTILIVDDERERCASLSELFATRGFRAVIATNPRSVPSMPRFASIVGVSYGARAAISRRA